MKVTVVGAGNVGATVANMQNVVSRKTLNTDRHIFSLLSTIQLLL